MKLRVDRKQIRATDQETERKAFETDFFLNFVKDAMSGEPHALAQQRSPDTNYTGDWAGPIV
jgi:hypothetical protein